MRAVMYRNFHQEAFSRAYIRAIAAAAGFKYSDGPLPDDDHVDATVTSRGLTGVVRSPGLDIQVKCKLGAPEGDPIPYALDVDAYEGLRHLDYVCPRILVVVFVPRDIALWTEHAEDGLMLWYCGYWVSLRGCAETSNQNTVTVYLPRKNMFGVAGITELMARVGRKEAL